MQKAMLPQGFAFGTLPNSANPPGLSTTLSLGGSFFFFCAHIHVHSLTSKQWPLSFPPFSKGAASIRHGDFESRQRYCGAGYKQGETNSSGSQKLN